MMMIRLLPAVAAGVMLLANGAYAQPSRVDYGIVSAINQVDVDKDGNPAGTAAGALLGGAVGYGIGKGSSRGKRRRSISAGGTAGGLITNNATRGSNKAYEYSVRLVDGSNVTIVTEQGQIQVGDCVSVERGPSANVRHASEVHCQANDTQATREDIVEAEECEAAKAAMLEADTSAAIEEAVRKARLACEE